MCYYFSADVSRKDLDVKTLKPAVTKQVPSGSGPINSWDLAQSGFSVTYVSRRSSASDCYRPLVFLIVKNKAPHCIFLQLISLGVVNGENNKEKHIIAKFHQESLLFRQLVIFSWAGLERIATKALITCTLRLGINFVT